MVSQPKPSGNKSPYFGLAERYNLKIDFRPFIQINPTDVRQFRKQKINILDFTAVIFTSRNAVDHFFRLAAEKKVEIPADMKYFCVSEAISNYLQNFITFRKRKVFTGEQSFASLIPVMQKHSEGKFLFPCSDVLKARPNKSLEESGLDYTKAQMYKVACSDLSDLKDVKYDILVFFSPTGIKSLFENFPDFEGRIFHQALQGEKIF